MITVLIKVMFIFTSQHYVLHQASLNGALFTFVRGTECVGTAVTINTCQTGTWQFLIFPYTVYR